MIQLAERRKGAGFETQTEFAGALGVSLATVSRLESGERRPSYPLAVKIAHLTNSTASEIMELFFNSNITEEEVLEESK